MSDSTWDPQGTVPDALQRIIGARGQTILFASGGGTAKNVSGLVSDQLGDVPAKTRELLRQAIELGVADELDKSRRSGLTPDESINSVAAMLVRRTPTDATGCMWVTREFARALGMSGSGQEAAVGREQPTLIPPKTEGPGTVVPPTPPPNGGIATPQTPHDGDAGHVGPKRPPSVAVAGIVGVVIVVVVALVVAHSNHKWPFSSVATTVPTNPPPSSSSSSSSSTVRTTPPPAPPSPKQEATQLSDLLVQSSSDRMAIVNAVSDIGSCQDLVGDDQTLTNAASNRQTLLTQLSALNLSGLPNNTQLSQALAGAWTASKASDQFYSKWANDELAGCSSNNTSDPNYQNAQTTDAQSTADKTIFSNLWNPIANQYGLPQVTPTSF